MGFEGLKIANQMKRGLIFTTRICYRSVCNHPFLLGFVFFLIFLYRSFPFVFSILVSSSPVLVCTIILLGTLLSFGQPHIPEIEKDIEKEVKNEENITHEIAALKSPSGVLEDNVVVERGESIGVERYTGEAGDVAEKTIEDRGLEGIDANIIHKGDDLVECAPCIEENSLEIHSEKQVIDEEEEEFNDFQCGPVANIHEQQKSRDEGVLGEGEVVMNEYTLIQSLEDEDHEVENDKSPVGSVVGQMGDSPEFSPESSWKHVEDENDPSDSGSDGGSDGGESSSPDASMTDIIPLLDELHPLLDSEPLQPVLVSHDDSDVASEQSRKSNDGSAESSEDNEKPQEEDDDKSNDDDDDEEEEDDDDDEDEEEEETQGSKEGESRSGITWTEDDQKNLLDLGTSELERNQRLENLIMRRRARKNMKMGPEKNLIDLESVDPPFNVPPISTRRRNPFDSPCDDSYDNMGLPPIPGSAPSILAPRRNPFDLPYDSSEEKPDLKGDSFEQEFMAMHQKDMLFRRHESFSLGASSLGGPRQERQHIKWRPYFVPERMAGEGPSYTMFDRQSSGFSDSKASSVPETESVSSAVEEEDTKVIDQDVPQETEDMSSIDQVSDRAEDGRESSEVSDSEESDQVEKTEIDLNVAAQPADEVNHHEIESSLATPVEMEMGEVHLEAETGKEKYSSRSSSPQSSEVSDQSFELKPDEESSILESRTAEVIEESGIQRQPSQEKSDFSSITRFAVEDQHHQKEPVYDLSPRAIEKNLSSSSISSDLPVEMSEIVVPIIVSSETTAPMACKESEVGKEIMEGTSSNEETLETSSQLHVVEENESRSEEVKEMSERDDIEFRFSAVDQNSDNPRSEAPKSVSEHISADLGSSASDTESVEKVMMHKDECFRHEQDQVDQLNVGAEFQTREVHQEMSENRDLMTSRDLDISSESIALSAMEEQSPLVVEQVSEVHPNLSSSETNSVEEDSADKEETLQFEHHQVHSSGYDAKIGDNQDVDEKLVSVDVSNLSSSETKLVEEDSTIREETLQLEHHQVTSSSFDAKIDDIQDVNEKQVSVDVSNLSSSQTKSGEEDSTMEETLHLEPHLVTSSVTKSAEENATGKEETPHDQVQSPVSDLNIGDHPNVGEKLASVDGSTSSSSETKSEKDKSTGNEETLQFEHDRVLLSSSDGKIGSHLDDNEKLGDGSQNVSCREVSLSELEKSLLSPLSDQSTVKPSVDDHEEVTAHAEPHEPYIIPVECIEEVGITNNPNVLRSHEPEDNISVYPSLTSILSEALENTLPSSTVDPKYRTIDGIENDNHKLSDLVLLGFPVAAHPVLEENVDDDEANEIKEFDEGLLAELDRVGDFSVNGVGLNLNEIAETKNIQFVEDDFQEVDESKVVIEEENNKFLEVKESDSEFQLSRASSTEHVGFGEEEVNDSKTTQEPLTNSEILVIEARSLEDIDLVFKGTESVSKETGVKFTESMLPDSEISSGMPLIEIKSLEDIDLALKDAEPMPREAEVEDMKSMMPDVEIHLRMPIIEAQSLEDIDLALKDAEPMAREAEVEDVEFTMPNVEINLRMPIIEAQSLEDINLAFKDTELMSKEDEIKFVEFVVPADPVIGMGMPIIEAQSLEDINLVLKDAEPVSIKTEIESSDSTIPPLEINSMMPVIDARSLEDLDLAFKNTESMSKEAEVIGKSKVPEDDSRFNIPENDVNSEMLEVEARSLKDVDLTLRDSELMSEVVVETEESKVHSHEISTEMPIIGARSLEDIGLALNDAEARPKEFNMPDLVTNLVIPTLEDRFIEDIDTACQKNNEEEDEKPMVLELPVLEARSIEDIDLAFKQLGGGVEFEKPIISIPIHEKPFVESKYPGGETNSDLQMVEAGSLEDIHKALKQATEDDKGTSTKENDSRTEESGFQSTSTAQTPDHGTGI